jgi:hypothetical protein
MITFSREKPLPMKKLILGFAGFAALSLSSCCFCNKGDGHAEGGHHHDSTATTEEGHHEEESVLAFDGVDKGDYVLYGHTEISPDKAWTTTEMYAAFENSGSFNDKVKVNIDEVCQKAGCWITFKDDKGESVRVFFRDHFTIPIETTQNTEAVLYGSLVVDTLSVDFQKHLLDDAKEAGENIPQSEYDAITEDKIERTFDCEAILVKKAAH